MKTIWRSEKTAYDGSQLSSLYSYLNFGVPGDSIVAWEGACDIPFDKMVDGEDRLAKSEIAGSHMLHFIIEKFDLQLRGAVYLQRLFAATAMEVLRATCAAAGQTGDGELLSRLPNVAERAQQALIAAQMFRSGDDIYVGDRKLSISIATISPVSTMIHFAVNVSTLGTPVKTIGLNDMLVNPEKFAHHLMALFASEVLSSEFATQKVSWVK